MFHIPRNQTKGLCQDIVGAFDESQYFAMKQKEGFTADVSLPSQCPLPELATSSTLAEPRRDLTQ